MLSAWAFVSEAAMLSASRDRLPSKGTLLMNWPHWIVFSQWKPVYSDTTTLGPASFWHLSSSIYWLTIYSVPGSTPLHPLNNPMIQLLVLLPPSFPFYRWGNRSTERSRLATADIWQTWQPGPELILVAKTIFCLLWHLLGIVGVGEWGMELGLRRTWEQLSCFPRNLEGNHF